MKQALPVAFSGAKAGWSKAPSISRLVKTLCMAALPIDIVAVRRRGMARANRDGADPDPNAPAGPRIKLI